MQDSNNKPKPPLYRRLLMPRGRQWRWAALRVCILAGLLILFRFQVLSWLVAGHNLAWRWTTGNAYTNPSDAAYLQRLGAPGLRMLVRLEGPGKLAFASDARTIPMLKRMVAEDPDLAVRSNAIAGLTNFTHPEGVPRVIVEALDDPDQFVRQTAALAFYNIGTEEHLALLKAHAEREDVPGIKQSLYAAIERIDPSPVPISEADRFATVRVAAIQFMSAMGGPDLNRQRLEAFIREAANNGAKIVVVPETSISGYMSTDLKRTWHVEGWAITRGLHGLSPADVAETVPGPSTEAFGALAKELGIYLTVPFLEVDSAEKKYFNTLCLVGPDGKLLLHYRKLNPWPFAERSWASPGDRGLQTIDTEYGRLALLICYDINFEPPRLHALDVDTLLYSIAWVDRERSTWFAHKLPAIARENNINIIGANWTVPRPVDWHGYGQSLIISRAGHTLSRVGRDIGEEIIYADLPIPSKSE